MVKSMALSGVLLASAFVGCSASDGKQGVETRPVTGGATSGDSAGITSGGSTTGAAGSSTTGGADPWASDGGVSVTVTTLAGNGTNAYRDGSGGHGGKAEFQGPNGVAIDIAGNVYVADTMGHRIRKIDLSGNVTTLAGNGSLKFQDGSGGADGTASFSYPSGLALNEATNALLVSDDGVNRIRQVLLSDGTTSTFAGTGKSGFVDGAPGTAELNFQGYASFGFSGMCGDGQGHFFIADPTNNAIRTLDASGNVGTLAGNGIAGFRDGAGGRRGVARFNAPGGCATDGAGNVYIADFGNNRIRKIDAQGNVTTFAGNGAAAHHDGTGGPGGTAEIFHPAGVAYDPVSGVLFAPDTFADFVQRIEPDGSVLTIAGDGTGWRDGPGAQAEFDAPAGMAVDSQGRLILVDFFGYDVRILTPAAP